VIVRVGCREIFGSAENLSPASDLVKKLLSLRDHKLAPLLRIDATPDGQWIFVSEAMRGVPLLEHARGMGLSRRNHVELFIEVCKAVHALHQRCLAHRDLRPSKILVDGKSNLKITDFAVAALTDFDLRLSQTGAEAQGLGFLWQYRSPEQQRGEAERVDIRSDIYTLGVVLSELLTGSPPQNPATGGFAVRGELGAIVRKAMAPDPDSRYASALAMAEDLDNYLRARPVQACSGGTLYRFSKLLARRRLFVGAAVLAVALPSALGVTQYNLAMRDAAKQRRDLAAKLAGEVALGQAAVEEAQAEARRSREALGEVENDRAELESQVAALRRDLASAEDARQTLGPRNDLVAGVPDPSKDFTALLVDVITGTNASPPTDSNELPFFLLHLAAEAAETRLAGWPDMKITFLEGLVGASRGLGRLDEASRLQEKVVAFKKADLGEADRGTLDSSNELAMLLYGNGRFKEAEALCRSLLDVTGRTFGNEHERTATAANNLAMTLRAQGNLNEAVPLFQRAMEARVQRLGHNHLKTACTTFELAAVLFESGKIGESEQMFRESVAVFEQQLPPTHWQLATAEERFAGALMALGRFDEAEKRLLSSHHRFESALGAEHARTREVAAELVKLYTTWGKTEKAAQWSTPTPPSDAKSK
jgi:tetratricopeptide (TPR) repeat protein